MRIDFDELARAAIRRLERSAACTPDTHVVAFRRERHRLDGAPLIKWRVWCLRCRQELSPLWSS